MYSLSFSFPEVWVTICVLITIHNKEIVFMKGIKSEYLIKHRTDRAREEKIMWYFILLQKETHAKLKPKAKLLHKKRRKSYINILWLHTQIYHISYRHIQHHYAIPILECLLGVMIWAPHTHTHTHRGPAGTSRIITAPARSTSSANTVCSFYIFKWLYILLHIF